MNQSNHTVVYRRGFTLIELSIVLVIIGLIVGGVLVGQDLIRAAYVRAQISQIEKYNAAVNTFYGKYQALPGDLNQSVALRYGFTTRGTLQGQGDGNGLLEGQSDSSYSFLGVGLYQNIGENIQFWSDLTYANGLNLNLIDGSFTTSRISGSQNDLWGNLGNGRSVVGVYYPSAKIGQENYVYTFSQNGFNYYGIAVVAAIIGNGFFNSSPGLTVGQAYAIDSKTDDGLPQSGRVVARYLQSVLGWAYGGPIVFAYVGTQYGADPGTASPFTALSCYDNAGNASSPMQYSVAKNKNIGNCALSFQFQ